MPRYMCRFCGIDYDESEIAGHLLSSHRSEVEKEKDELVKILETEEDRIKKKAGLYDNIVSKAILSCGIIERDCYTKYMVDPEFFTDVLLPEILLHVDVDREKMIEFKKTYINGMIGEENEQTDK